MKLLKSSCLSAIVTVTLCAGASAQVRLFMAADGTEAAAPTTGNTTLVMTAGTTQAVSIWVDDSVGTDPLNFYQVIIRMNAVPTAGSEGAVAYMNDGLPNGGSVALNTARPDFVFAGQPVGPPFFNENTAQNGFGVIGNLTDLNNGNVMVPDIRYMGHFALTATADACGTHTLAFVPENGIPAGGTSMGGPGGLQPYPNVGGTTTLQSLTIDLGACGGGCTDPCDDENACTIADACDGDTCVGEAVDCSGAGDACNVASCDAGGAEGNCDTLMPANEGGACDDGNACTVSDSCGGGDCAGDAVDCSGAGDECNVASCDSGGANGNCDILMPANEGGACNGGMGTCMSGTCVGGGDVTTRLFMAADGTEGGQPTTGNTTVTVAAGSTVDVSVWLHDNVQDEDLNYYQVIMRYSATPQAGATGDITYVNDGMPNGNSVLVDTARADFVFAGADFGPPFYNETLTAMFDTSGFGFIGNLNDLLSGQEVVGIRYLGEFTLSASADASGSHELVFVPLGLAPAAGTALGQPGGLLQYNVDVTQSLTVVVGDAPECPLAAEVVMVDPLDGTVDARQPHPVGNVNPAQGIDTFVVTAPLGVPDSCWSVCETDDGGDPNGVASVTDDGAGEYTITLDRPATAGAVTALQSGGSTVGLIYFHPSNVNADDLAGPLDILAIIDILNNVLTPAFGEYSSDINQSNLVEPLDILAVIDLLNGADTHDVWLDTSLPDPTGCE